MKTLLVLRHGKAVASDPGGDHDRSLNGRGSDQAAEIGALLARLGLVPDLALVSDARRTRETAELALSDPSTRVELDPRLYAATADQMLAVIRGANDSVQRLLLVGHNPGIGELARALEREGDPQAVIGLQESFPTAALAVLDFGIASWAEAARASATLSRFIVPGEAATVR